jgi:hypothetical protein
MMMKLVKTDSFLKRYWILLILVVIKMVLQYILVNPVYELHRDEFLHLDQAFHPALGYISVPPFTAWISSLIYWFGGGIFWIRFFPALFGAITIVVTWLIVEETGGSLAARTFVAVSLIFSVLIRINLLFQPNSFDILAWTLVFYCLIRYANSKQQKWILMLSVVIALGFYNKYNVVFLIAGLVAGLLLTQHRKLLTQRIFYLSLAMCLLLILPNIIWQIRYSFPVIHHMKALKDSQLVNVHRIDFLLDQVKYGLFGILAIAALAALIIYKTFKPYRFIGWTFVIVILLYTLSRAKSYYTIGLYPVLFALGGVYLEAILKKWKGIVFTLLALINIGIMMMIMLKDMMPVQNPADIAARGGKSSLYRWEDGKEHILPQDFSDMLGWREMAEKALKAYHMIPLNELDSTLVYCDNYGQAGALNYFNRGKMPEAYSFNTDYMYWMPVGKKIKNIVFVGNLPRQEIVNRFREYKPVDVVKNEYAREKGTRIFLLLGANPSASSMLWRLAEERKKNFDIF